MDIMIISRKISLVLAGLWVMAVMFSWGCEAPRNNPLDPLNPNRPYGTIAGIIQTESIPRQPIAGAQVIFVPSGQYYFTDSQGAFSIDNVKPVDGWLFFEKEGFLSDSTFVSWGDSKHITVSIFLNAEPQLHSLSMYSVVRNKYPDIQDHELVIRAFITDAENDIDSVYVENEQLNIKKFLRYNADSKNYERTFLIYDFGLKSLKEIEGYVFQLIVKDKLGHLNNTGQDKLSRVILEEIEYVSPSDYLEVPPTPTLVWKEFDPGFRFTYNIQVFTDEYPSRLVWEQSQIPPDSTSYTVSSALAAGDYYWAIWCIDDFQNRSRSKPASFSVR